MNDFNDQNFMSSAGSARGDGEDDRVMPLGVGEFDDGAEGDVIGKGEKKKFSTSTLIIPLVVILAAAGLWSMRSLAIAMAGGKTSDQGLENTIESFLSSLAGESATDTGNSLVVGATGEMAVGESLFDDRTELQVPLTDVRKNPFVMYSAKPKDTTADPTPVADPWDEDARRRAEHEEQRNAMRVECEKAVTKLRLLMIMGGTEPMANINGKVVRIGDTIVDDRLGINLKVTEIVHGAVTLTVEDPSIGFAFRAELRLHQDAK